MKSQQNTVLKEGPVNWELIRLKDVIVEIINGFACGRRDDGGIVQIRMNNVTIDGRLIFDKFLRVPIPNSIDIMLLRQGDFLFNNTNSIDLVGKSTVFNEAPFPCTFSNHFTRIRLKTDQIIPEFLLYSFLILWEKNYFRSLAIRHVGQAAVHKKYLVKLKLLLPPLPEQKKIAEILTTVDEAIEKVDEAIKKAERLKKGLMQTLLTLGIGHKEFIKTKLGQIPIDWKIVKINDVADVIGGKRLPKGNRLVDDLTQFPYIRVVDFKNMKVDQNNIKYLDMDTHKKIKNYTISSDDVYISIAGTVGLSGNIPTILNGANLTENAAKLCNLRNIAKTYLAYVLNSKIGQNQIKSFVGRAQQPKLALFRIEKIKLPLPPLREQ